MRVSQLLGKTIKDVKDSGSISHELLLRAGYIRQLGSGLFSYMHLAKRTLDKISTIIREEMNVIGGVEVNMPILQPAENWKKTNRYFDIDDSLFRFQDRHGKDMVLAMTHEEAVGNLGAFDLDSYRDLPKLIYQIQTKVRDEQRPRGGIVRGREFIMKDSYSFDATWDGLYHQYERHMEAYTNIFKRLGLPVAAIESDSGMMGGKVAHEFMYFSAIGEDAIYTCSSCGYMANSEIARFKKEPFTLKGSEISLVKTPNTTKIEEVCSFLGKAPEEIVKTIIHRMKIAGKEEMVFSMVRGDMQLNEVKLQNYLKGQILRLATAEEIAEVGGVVGYASSINLDVKRIIVVVDDVLTQEKNLVIGANKEGAHYVGAEFNRDFFGTHVVDISECSEGRTCWKCDTKLSLKRGVEVGNIFQLGTKYSESLGAFFVDDEGKQQAIIMGSYGIGVSRLLACLADHYHDDKGLKWKEAIAPYRIQLISFAENQEVVDLAEKLYQHLTLRGVEVLYDDRSQKMASAGHRFKDYELRGIPQAIVVSKRCMQSNRFEIIDRNKGEKIFVAEEDLFQIDYDKI